MAANRRREPMTPKAKAKEPTHAPHGEGMSPEELHERLK